MIRRTLKSGLLATVAVLAFLPTAAGATAASATTQHPVPSAATRYDTHHRGHVTLRTHHRVHLHKHQPRRVHRPTPRGAAFHSVPLTTTYRFAPYMAPYRLQYRLQYRLVAQSVPYRHLQPATGRVTTRHARLNVRSGPGTGYRVIGHRHTGRRLALACRTRGSSVHGNRTWYRLSHHRGYVSARYVRADRALPWC
ncbi:SH3 domain-containing protein [Streptomyces sp. NPDC007205]|uniref:SH3 domain-containing protein n=1 Tax=Streptomyces sp. NPDC007205 TaxID=3154316 RepID=UPI0033CA10B6